MKRKTLAVTILFAAFTLFQCNKEVKGQAFNVGDKHLNFTIGFGSPWVLYNDYRTVLPPVAVSFDYGFRDDLGPGVIGIGVLAAATTYKNRVIDYGWLNEYGWKSTTLIAAARATYHYQLINALDTYGGFHLGVRFESWREYGDFPVYERRNIGASYHPVFNLFAGAKYSFSDDLFIMAEVGLGISIINVGLGLKL